MSPPPWQKARERLEKLNGETQRIEKKLQEERMEREKVEVELGREKDCNRVKTTVPQTIGYMQNDISSY